MGFSSGATTSSFGCSNRVRFLNLLNTCRSSHVVAADIVAIVLALVPVWKVAVLY